MVAPARASWRFTKSRKPDRFRVHGQRRSGNAPPLFLRSPQNIALIRLIGAKTTGFRYGPGLAHRAESTRHVNLPLQEPPRGIKIRGLPARNDQISVEGRRIIGGHRSLEPHRLLLGVKLFLD
jgi:hypothetical protein